MSSGKVRFSNSLVGRDRSLISWFDPPGYLRSTLAVPGNGDEEAMIAPDILARILYADIHNIQISDISFGLLESDFPGFIFT
jgi:hypothetical protein